MKRGLILAVVVSILLFGSAYCVQSPEEQQVINSVCLVVNPDNGNCGTGTLFLMGERIFLATAGHVAKGCASQNTLMVICGKDGTPQIHQLVQNTVDKKSLRWKIHPKADVATIELGYPVTFSNLNVINTDWLVRGLEDVDRDAVLTIVGFPNALGMTGTKFSPITMRAYACSGMIETKDYPSMFFLLDKPGINGYSGAPVSRLTSRFGGMVTVVPPQVVGILAFTSSDNTGGKMAGIIPAQYILDLMDGAKK